MVDVNRTPGPRTPGPRTVGPDQPGPRLPDQSAVLEVEVSADGVPADATGTTFIGTPEGVGGQVEAVVVNGTAADFDFNVNADGEAVFASPQSPAAAAEETFTPQTELAEFDGPAPDLDFEVTGASATGGATATVTVVVSLEEQ